MAKKKRKPGRPAGEPRRHMSIRMPERLIELLHEASAREDTTTTGIIVDAVERRLARKRRRRAK